MRFTLLVEIKPFNRSDNNFASFADYCLFLTDSKYYCYHPPGDPAWFLLIILWDDHKLRVVKQMKWSNALSQGYIPWLALHMDNNITET